MVDLDQVTARIDECEPVWFSTGLTTPRAGRIGLWVDIGTDAHFANLQVTPQ